MPYTTLITPAQLHPHLDETGWVIIDCRFNLAAPAAGGVEYARAHIPNARYAHLDADLSSPIGPGSGRHPLPERDRLAQRLGQWGVQNNTQVVVYDTSHGTIAARLWWLLRWLGHERVALLDGGLARWQQEGYPLNGGKVSATVTSFIPAAPLEQSIDSTTLQRLMAQGERLLIDVRAPERFRGEVEPLDKVAGHIPGAINVPLQHNLDSSGNFLPAAQLHALYQPLLTQHQGRTTTLMCGSGVTACHTLLALRIAGFEHAELYPGSWSEWITDPTRGVAKGDRQH